MVFARMRIRSAHSAKAAAKRPPATFHLGRGKPRIAFQAPFMDVLGLTLKFKEPSPMGSQWAGWKHPDRARPLFLIGRPHNGEAAEPGNGQMIALLAPDRATVDKCATQLRFPAVADA